MLVSWSYSLLTTQKFEIIFIREIISFGKKIKMNLVL